ncbi:MAG: copper resistance protein CopC [Pseudomonadales bacterium]|nr:copper resistance protein CopC [Pseudomonadales bacterium]
MMKILSKPLAMLALMLVSSLALAHTGLKESTPADGTTVKMAPAAIDLVFNGDVRLIKFELSSGDQEMETGFKPVAETMANYSIATPALSEGSYTVNWAVIGADGHTVTNSFSFSVDAAAVAATQ